MVLLIKFLASIIVWVILAISIVASLGIIIYLFNFNNRQRFTLKKKLIFHFKIFHNYILLLEFVNFYQVSLLMHDKSLLYGTIIFEIIGKFCYNVNVNTIFSVIK